MIQDGAIAQAVDQVAAAGVSYFSSAGNFARNSYEASFNPSGQTVFGFGEAHDFDPSEGVDLYQNFSIPTFSVVLISFQWDSPSFSVSGAPGSTNDLDIFITDEPPTQILSSSMNINVGGDPFEFVGWASFDSAETFNIVSEGITGPLPGLIKHIIINGASSINE